MKNALVVTNALTSLAEFIKKNFGLELSDDDVRDIEQRLSDICANSPSDGEVIAKLDLWKKKVKFSDKRFTFEDVTSLKDVNFTSIFSHEILYEERALKFTHEPYRRQMASQEIEHIWTYRRPDYTQPSCSWAIKGGESITICPSCNGTKILVCLACFGSGEHKSSCPACSGSGKISRSVNTSQGYKYFDSQCVRCGATGRISTRCFVCGGSGRLPCHNCGPTGEVFNFRQVTSTLKPTTNIRFLGAHKPIDVKKIPKLNKTLIYQMERTFEDIISETRMLVSDKLDLFVVYNRIYSADTTNGILEIRVENYNIKYPAESLIRTKNGKIMYAFYWIFIIALIAFGGYLLLLLYRYLF